MNIIYGLGLLAGVHVIITWMAAIWHGLRARQVQQHHASHQLAMWPFVSVIIPAWQERGTLERCIASLRLVGYPEWEVVIVAGGLDGTYRAAVEACQGLEHFQVIEQLPRGKNAALNAGVRAARGEVIVLVDADSQVPLDWLRELVAPLNGVIGATTGNPVPLRPTAIALGEQMDRIAAYEIHHSIVLQGCGSIAIQREVIEEIGGFPENVWSGVDWDLDARLAARGAARAFCPDANVYTERPATLSEYWRNEVRWRRAHLTSLFRLRAHFLRDVPSVFSSLYIYALAWFSLLFTGITIATVVLGSPQVRVAALILWSVFIAWVALRRAALAIQVTAYRHQARWLRYLWVPPLLLFITFAASCIASGSIHHATMHFKGPRSVTGESQ